MSALGFFENVIGDVNLPDVVEDAGGMSRSTAPPRPQNQAAGRPPASIPFKAADVGRRCRRPSPRRRWPALSPSPPCEPSGASGGAFGDALFELLVRLGFCAAKRLLQHRVALAPGRSCTGRRRSASSRFLLGELGQGDHRVIVERPIPGDSTRPEMMIGRVEPSGCGR